jgi:hypothetical protein
MRVYVDPMWNVLSNRQAWGWPRDAPRHEVPEVHMTDARPERRQTVPEVPDARMTEARQAGKVATTEARAERPPREVGMAEMDMADMTAPLEPIVEEVLEEAEAEAEAEGEAEEEGMADVDEADYELGMGDVPPAVYQDPVLRDYMDRHARDVLTLQRQNDELQNRSEQLARTLELQRLAQEKFAAAAAAAAADEPAVTMGAVIPVAPAAQSTMDIGAGPSRSDTVAPERGVDLITPEVRAMIDDISWRRGSYVATEKSRENKKKKTNDDRTAANYVTDTDVRYHALNPRNEVAGRKRQQYGDEEFRPQQPAGGSGTAGRRHLRPTRLVPQE